MLDLIKQRFSPYNFTGKSITEQDLKLLFESAGKAASAFNEQPWRFVYALKEDDVNFKRLHDCLLEGNKEWSKDAAALTITVVKENFTKNNKPNNVCKHDLGLAVGNLTIQALSMSIYLHQMSGINHKKAIDLLNIPEGFIPVTAIAFGYYDGKSGVKSRKSLNEIVFKGAWEG